MSQWREPSTTAQAGDDETRDESAQQHDETGRDRSNEHREITGRARAADHPGDDRERPRLPRRGAEAATSSGTGASQAAHHQGRGGGEIEQHAGQQRRAASTSRFTPAGSLPSSPPSACSSQNGMSISRYIVVAVVRCSRACSRVAGAPVELAEAEVAVGDEGTHAARLGEGQGSAVVGLGRCSASNRSGWVAMSPSRWTRVGREPGVARREDSIARSPRRRASSSRPSSRQAAAQSSDRPSHDGRRRRSPRAARRAARLPRSRLSASLASPELRQHPRRRGDGGAQKHQDVPGPEDREPALDQCSAPSPSRP